jgi:hypothetical protein
MQRKFTLLGGVAFGAMIALGAGAQASAKVVHHHHMAATQGGVDKVAALTDEVETLERRLEAESQAREQLQGQVQAAQSQAAAAQADAQAAHGELAAQIQTIPGEVRTEIAAEKLKDGKTHYKGVALAVGGFAAAESVYRSRNEEADIGSSFAKIPFANNPLAHTSEFRGTARQSRLSLLAEGDISPDTHAAFYTEMDFLAGPQTANSNESNSFSPRIRNVYGTLDMGHFHLLAGQNWSLTTMNSKGITPRNEVPPPTIEAQYVEGFVWARQPQLRITGDFDNKQLWAAVSVENPQSTFGSAATGTTGTSVSGLTVTTGAASTSQFDSANTLSLNHIPDVVGKVAFEPDFGGSRPLHMEAFGIYRSFTDRVNVTAANSLGLPVGVSNRNTDGGGFGGGVSWTVVPKLLDIQGSAMTGRGIGRYGSGQLPDTIVAPDGSLKALQETMFLVGGTLHATPALDFYVFGGEEFDKASQTTIGANHYGYGSPFANLTGCFVEGGACTVDLKSEWQLTAGLWDKIYQGSFGSVRVGLQYSYTELTGFAGSTGPAPKTNDNMIFTSFRYYPF